MRNPNEYSIRIYVEPNDIDDYRKRGHVERQLVVETGSVDINELVEDMINTLEKPL